MIIHVFFMPAAGLEVTEAQDWYESKSRGLGVLFRGEIDRQVDRLAENPLHFPRVFRDVRRARLHQFPHALFFRPMGNELYVIACFQSSRDPLIWQNRV